MVDASSNSSRRAQGIAPPPRLATKLRELITQEGESALALRLGLGRPTLARLAGRLTCRRGSILQAAQALGMELES